MPKQLSVSAIALALLAAPAGATCSQTDATGTWALYSIGANNSGVFWTKCHLVVGSNGSIVSKYSTCRFSAGGGTAVTGNVKLSNAVDCTFSGSLTYYWQGITSTIIEATLDRTKNIANGVGYVPGGGFSFNMTRI